MEHGSAVSAARNSGSNLEEAVKGIVEGIRFEGYLLFAKKVLKGRVSNGSAFFNAYFYQKSLIPKVLIESTVVGGSLMRKNFREPNERGGVFYNL